MIIAVLVAILLVLTATLRTIKQGFKRMSDSIALLISAFNDGTNAVAARIDRLIAGQANTASPEQLTEMQAISDHLKALGQDPSNPVPAPAPTV